MQLQKIQQHVVTFPLYAIYYLILTNITNNSDYPPLAEHNIADEDDNTPACNDPGLGMVINIQLMVIINFSLVITGMRDSLSAPIK